MVVVARVDVPVTFRVTAFTKLANKLVSTFNQVTDEEETEVVAKVEVPIEVIVSIFASVAVALVIVASDKLAVPLLIVALTIVPVAIVVVASAVVPVAVISLATNEPVVVALVPVAFIQVRLATESMLAQRVLSTFNQVTDEEETEVVAKVEVPIEVIVSILANVAVALVIVAFERLAVPLLIVAFPIVPVAIVVVARAVVPVAVMLLATNEPVVVALVPVAFIHDKLATDNILVQRVSSTFNQVTDEEETEVVAKVEVPIEVIASIFASVTVAFVIVAFDKLAVPLLIVATDIVVVAWVDVPDTTNSLVTVAFGTVRP